MRVRPRDIIQTQQNERARERASERKSTLVGKKVVDDSGRAGLSGLNSRPTRQRTPVSRGLNSVNYSLSLPACAASSAGHYVAALMMAPSQSVNRPFFSVFLSRRRFLFSASFPPYERFSLFMDNTMGEGRISIPPLPLFLFSLTAQRRVMNRPPFNASKVTNRFSRRRLVLDLSSPSARGTPSLPPSSPPRRQWSIARWADRRTDG